MAIAGLVTGYIGTLMTLGFAGLMIYGMLEDTKVTGKPEDLFPLPESGRITLPDLVGGELMEGTRVKIYEASASGGHPEEEPVFASSSPSANMPQEHFPASSWLPQDPTC